MIIVVVVVVQYYSSKSSGIEKIAVEVAVGAIIEPLSLHSCSRK